MPVDPINDQASSRYEKSETTTMKLLLLFMFVAVAVATEVSETELAKGFVRIFNITQEQGLECIRKTGVVVEDLRKLEDSIDRSESEFTDTKSMRTASCATVCAAQKQGTMVGKEIQLDEVFKYLERMTELKDTLEKVKDSARFCKKEVAVIEDECMIGYKFVKCMYVRSHTNLEEK